MSRHDACGPAGRQEHLGRGRTPTQRRPEPTPRRGLAASDVTLGGEQGPRARVLVEERLVLAQDAEESHRDQARPRTGERAQGSRPGGALVLAPGLFQRAAHLVGRAPLERAEGDAEEVAPLRPPGAQEIPRRPDGVTEHVAAVVQVAC